MYTVYSKPACPACDKAKAMISTKGLSYQEIIIDVGQQKAADKTYISREELLAKFPTARTVPQIMLNDTYIGGFDQLQQTFEPLAA